MRPFDPLLQPPKNQQNAAVGVTELRFRMFCNTHFLSSQNVNVLFAAVFPEPLLAGVDLLFVGICSPCIVRAEARGQRQSTACAVVILLLVLFLGRLRLPLFSSLLGRGLWRVKRTLGTSVPTFIRLVFCLLEFDYDYLGFAGFIDYAYLDWWAGGGEGGWT